MAQAHQAIDESHVIWLRTKATDTVGCDRHRGDWMRGTGGICLCPDARVTENLAAHGGGAATCDAELERWPWRFRSSLRHGPRLAHIE